MSAFPLLSRLRFACLVTLGLFAYTIEAQSTNNSVTPTNSPIPWTQIGAQAMAQYSGDGLAVTAIETGARLHCAFQKLEGCAASDGLWLTSTVTNTMADRFRVVAVALGRTADFGMRWQSAGATPLVEGVFMRDAPPCDFAGMQDSIAKEQLDVTGRVEAARSLVRFVRPRLLEEYSVSVDGVRQDFVVTERLPGAGELQVRLEVAGAKVEPIAGGVYLVLEQSGRRIAFSRLRVTDATGKELSARMDVMADGAQRSRCIDAAAIASKGNNLDNMEMDTLGRPESYAPLLAVMVNDAGAVYPLRIDPTFSDANWTGIGRIAGADNYSVYATAVDGAGNLYIGGYFSVAGDVLANNIAKWNGSGWSALGSGLDSQVNALAVSGSDVYAGGLFTTAGGAAAAHIAKWNGTSWSALGSGMGGGDGYPDYSSVTALAVSGNDLYAGGYFTTAGGNAANYIAKWNGSVWSALGSGLSGGIGFFGYSRKCAGGARERLICRWLFHNGWRHRRQQDCQVEWE